MTLRKISFFSMAVGLACIMQGCGSKPAGTSTLADGTVASNGVTRPISISAASPQPMNDSAGHPLQAPVYPKMTVYKLALPLGALSESAAAWKLLNEDAIDGKTATMLARNGLRAATAAQSKWAEIVKLIERPGSSREEYQCQTDGHSPLSIVMHADVASQTIFFVDADLALQGRTFESSTNAMRFSMTQAVPGQPIAIQLEPYVKLPGGAGQGRFAMGQIIAPPEATFANLRLAVSVAAGDFLVVAPLDPKANPFSVGGRFLTNTDKVPLLEYVLVFVPMAADKPKH